MDERTRAAAWRNAENSARLAFADFHFRVTDGNGFYQFPQAGDFGLTFAERPAVACGVFFDVDELANQLDIDDDGTLILPSITAMVTEWDQDERGFYVGAWCGVNVIWPETATIPEEGAFFFHVDFTFHGIAIKDVEPEVRD